MEFEELYSNYFREVFLFIKSLCKDEFIAEEVTQETFYKALKSIEQFDGNKDIKAWLFTIARNTYFTYYKKRNREIEIDSDSIFIQDDNILQKLSNKEEAFLVHKFLHKMKEPYKEVFSLRTFGELPYENIGSLFGKSSSWARVTFYRAKKLINQQMEELMNEQKND